MVIKNIDSEKLRMEMDQLYEGITEQRFRFMDIV